MINGILLLSAVGLCLQAGGRVLPVEEMVRKSDVVGVAVVRSSAPRLDDRTGIVRTEFVLEFSELWKGTPGTPYIVWKAGGQLGERATAIAGHEYTLAVGEQIVVFAHPSTAGHNVVVGLRQGLYRVGSGPDRPLYRVSEFPFGAGRTPTTTLAQLKDKVYDIVGRPTERPTDAPRPPAPEPPRATGAEPSPVAPPSAAVPAQSASGRNAGLAVALLLSVAAVATYVLLKRKTSVRN